MRKILPLGRTVTLDCESTGFDPQTGDRIVEIGLVEYIDRRPTGNVFHEYINPERSMPEDAFKVHKLSEKFLSDKKLFSDVAEGFLKFITGATIVIHNAPFDLGFFSMELARCGYPSIESCDVVIVDSLELAKRQGRTKRNNLNALCNFYGVDNVGRKVHGALLDAQLLGEVYLCMTRDQSSLLTESIESISVEYQPSPGHLGQLRVLEVTLGDGDLDAHEAYLNQIEKEAGGKASIWRLQA